MNESEKKVKIAKNILLVIVKGEKSITEGTKFFKTFGFIDDYKLSFYELGKSRLFDYLQQAFSIDEIEMMEIAFEKEYPYSSLRPAIQRFEAWAYHYDDAIAFGKKFENPSNRLKAIMENVVENSGKFKFVSELSKEMV